MKNILILGGAGFIGRNLCGYLSGKGYQVSCFDRLNDKKMMDGVSCIQGDFFNEDDLRNVVAGKDYIIHAISSLNPGNSNELYMQGYEWDFLQSVRLCKMLVGTDTKLIFLSSGGTIYGEHEKQPVNEETLPRPINHYGNIKLCIENTLRAFNYQMHNKMLVVRISNPYGPGQDFTKGVGFIDAALKQSLAGKTIEIWGDGENVRDYIYIEDVCRMIGSLLDYKGQFDTFNISSGIGVSQNDIIEMLYKLGLTPNVVYRNKRSVDLGRIVLDNQRIRNIWPYDLIPLEQGIKKYLAYLQQNL